MTDPTDRAAKEHTGAMIGFMLEPSDSKALLSAVPRKLAVDDDVLHLTLMYLGDTGLYDDGFQDVVGMALQLFALDEAPITGHVGGVGRFDDIEPDGTSALYASFDAAELPAFRQRLVDHLGALGIASPSEHGFTPHITLAYLPPGAQPIQPDVPALKLTFRGVTLAWGDTQLDYPLTGGGFMVTKEASGRLRWVHISSNSFQDRDREIVSQKALEADVERADQDGAYGTLDWWHLDGAPDEQGRPTPSLILGDCDFNAMHGRMLIESGTFRDERVGLAVKAHADQLGLSIAFYYPEGEPDAQGVYHHIRRYSRALLPREFASNPLTALPVIVKEQKDMLTKKVTALKKLMGGDEALVDAVLTFAETKEAAALSANLAHKEAAAAAAQKATITIADDDKPKGDEKPADEKPDDPPAASAAADKPAEPAPAAEDAPAAAAPDQGAPPPAPGAGTIGSYTEQQLAEYVAKCMDAWAEKRDAEKATQQAAKEAREVELLTTIKEQGEQLAHILKAAEAAGAGAAAALEGVAELKGETPRSRKGHRASQDGEEPTEEMKQKTRGPESDPFQKHWEKHWGNGVSQVPGQ